MRKAFVFDLDETLITTKAMIHVINKQTGKVEKRISPAVWNTYVLGKNEVFGFKEFRRPDLVRTGKPTFLIHLAKEVYDEGHSIFILTARDNSVMGAIRDFLNDYGIKAETIYCVGGDHDPNIGEEKRKVLLQIIKEFDKTYMYDDNEEYFQIGKDLGCKGGLI